MGENLSGLLDGALSPFFGKHVRILTTLLPMMLGNLAAYGPPSSFTLAAIIDICYCYLPPTTWLLAGLPGDAGQQLQQNSENGAGEAVDGLLLLSAVSH